MKRRRTECAAFNELLDTCPDDVSLEEALARFSDAHNRLGSLDTGDGEGQVTELPDSAPDPQTHD